MIKAAIIDSFPAFQKGIGKEVEQQADMQLVGTSNRGSEAITLVREQSPDVIILGVNRDSRVDAYDPLVVVQNLHKECPNLRIIILSNEAICVHELIELGVTGYVLKHDPEAVSMMQAIRVVHGNGLFYSEGIKELLSLSR